MAALLGSLLRRKTSEDVSPAAGTDFPAFFLACHISFPNTVLLHPSPGPEQVVRLLVPGLCEQPRGDVAYRQRFGGGCNDLCSADDLAMMEPHGACQYTSFYRGLYLLCTGRSQKVDKIQKNSEKSEGYVLLSAARPTSVVLGGVVYLSDFTK